MTLGVRIIVRNASGEVLLVRHTYVEGWHLPGGGVERGETFVEAAHKELLEECGIEAEEKVEYFHTYKNDSTSRFDHVALYVCHNWSQIRQKIPDAEIAETGFFALDELPEGTTIQTVRRLNEVFNNHPVSDHW